MHSSGAFDCGHDPSHVLCSSRCAVCLHAGTYAWTPSPWVKKPLAHFSIFSLLALCNEVEYLSCHFQAGTTRVVRLAQRHGLAVSLYLTSSSFFSFFISFSFCFSFSHTLYLSLSHTHSLCSSLFLMLYHDVCFSVHRCWPRTGNGTLFLWSR